MKKILSVFAVLFAFASIGFATTTESVLYSFTNNPDGRSPQGALSFITPKKSILIGTTVYGGGTGYGSVFTVTTNAAGGTEAVISSLTNTDFNGRYPNGLKGASGVVAVSGSNIFVIAQSGGFYDSSFGRVLAKGGIFSDSTNGGAFKALTHWGLNNSDPALPQRGLITGFDGALYGVTKNGGSANYGTVFRLNTNGQFVVLHNFLGNSSDGSAPVCTLAQGTNGFLYGTTEQGGTGAAGVLFQVATNGSSYTVFHNFGAGFDGARPHGGLLQVSSGLVYGTTAAGGTNNYGTIWTFDPQQTNYADIYSFKGGTTDGSQPEGGVVQTGNGNLYGSTAYGGSVYGDGTIWQIASGTYSTIWNFTNRSTVIDGATPLESPVVGFDNALYGSTSAGGTNNSGVVYRISP